ncbi:MAG: helix-turn-helix domain-containing protein [Patescibacteria group bacterium]
MKTIDKQHIIAQLRHFNCNEQEAQIYIHCLSSGPSTVQEISKKLGRHRTTIHSEIEQLLKKGLLFETRKEKKRYIGSENPNVLYSLLHQKENELSSIKNNISYAVELLNTITSADSSKPTVKFYEGIDGFKKLLESILVTKNEVLIFIDINVFQGLLGPDYLEKYYERRAAKGIHTRFIFPPCEFADRVNKNADKYKIQIRLMPEGLEWKSGIYCWDDTLAIISFPENKLTCTVIENKDIADFYRKLNFEFIWQQAKPI